MLQHFNRFLDWFSNTFAHRKGLLPLIGIALVLSNLFLSFFFQGWLIDKNILLHLGIIIAIFGFMIAWAL
jgi:mannose/fructose/N-acetylgalactosamine-specific phosphotransferase system component IIC